MIYIRLFQEQDHHKNQFFEQIPMTKMKLITEMRIIVYKKNLQDIFRSYQILV
jgi:hypothetical protein